MSTVHRSPGDTLEQRLARLSPRQFEILRLAAAGNSTARIAAILGMSPNTARIQIQSILVRLGVHSRLEAVSVALVYGMVAGNPLAAENGRSPGAGGSRPLGGS